jgi:uncharacterized membrane protein YedE/YeeE
MQNRRRAYGAAIGVVFGVVLCWSGMSSPEVIRAALLLEQSYLFLFFAAAVVTAAIGQYLVRRRAPRALLANVRVGWTAERPQRRHIVGSLVFGTGWGVADACPGPIATQLGQGIAWSLLTLAGVVIGVHLFLRRSAVGETEPATEPKAARGVAEPVGARA